MPQDPNFPERLSREIALFVREARDGCAACLASDTGCCARHDDLWAMGVQVNPRKYLSLASVRNWRPADGQAE